MAFRMFALWLGVLLSPVVVVAQSDCSEELAIIDARIAASADAPEQNKQIAQQLRSAMEQGCAYMDEPTRKAMLEALDDIFPTGSKEEDTARRRARSAELKAQREAKKAAAAAAPKAREYAVLSAAATARSRGGQYVDRADAMNVLWIRDWDVLDSKLRILYTTMPDLTQFGLPDWQFYVYVIEVSQDGSARQHLVTSKQAGDHTALALRRGHDEVFFLRHVQKAGQPTHFERWSISRGARLSSVDMTGTQPEVNGEGWRSAEFGVATSDGNFLFSAVRSAGRKKPVSVAWFKLSPEGKTLGSHARLDLADKVSHWAWFPTQDGGGGYVVNVAASTDAGLLSGEMSTFDPAPFPPDVVPKVFGEKRFFMISADARSSWESIALERMMMFEPRQPASQLTMAEAQARMADQHEASTLATRRYRTGRSVNYLNIGPRRVEMIRPLASGYGALFRVTADRSLRPPIHGQYLVTLDRGGSTGETYLAPMAEQLRAKFTAFDAAGTDGSFYLLGFAGLQGYIVLVDSEGEPSAYAKTAHPATLSSQNVVMVSGGNGVWVFGDGHPGGPAPRVWVERVEFP